MLTALLIVPKVAISVIVSLVTVVPFVIACSAIGAAGGF